MLSAGDWLLSKAGSAARRRQTKCAGTGCGVWQLTCACRAGASRLWRSNVAGMVWAGSAMAGLGAAVVTSVSSLAGERTCGLLASGSACAGQRSTTSAASHSTSKRGHHSSPVVLQMASGSG